MVDGECVKAAGRAPLVGRSSDVMSESKKKNQQQHFGYLVLQPLYVFTADSLHGSYLQPMIFIF